MKLNWGTTEVKNEWRENVVVPRHNAWEIQHQLSKIFSLPPDIQRFIWFSSASWLPHHHQRSTVALSESASTSATETPKSLAPNFSMLLSSTNFVPFLRASPSSSSSSAAAASKKPHFVLPDIPALAASAADKFSQFLLSLASQTPFLSKLISLRCEFQSICHQIGCRNHRQVKTLSAHNFAAVLPGDSVAGLVVANGISNFVNLYNTLLVVRLVLTWFPNSPPAIVAPLSTICDPYLNIFRGLIPPLGGTLDLSPILAFLVLNAFTSTAAALPAELPASPVSGASQQLVASPTELPTSLHLRRNG